MNLRKNKFQILNIVLVTALLIIISSVHAEESNPDWKKDYNFDQNALNQLSKDASNFTIFEPNTNNPAKKNSINSGVSQLQSRIKHIPDINQLISKSKNGMLGNDTLIIGAPPLDSLIIDKDYTYNGTILIALNGILRFKNCKATIKGDIILFNNARLEVENSQIYFPQQYFYQRMLFATGNSVIIVKNSSFDYSGLSHTLAVANKSKAEITNITNNGFTTTGLYGTASISIDGSNEAGEFVITDSTNLSIKNAKTALLWHHTGKNQKLDLTFPNGDSVGLYECRDGIAGVSGVGYKVKIEKCKEVMWALMPANGTEVKISDSKLRAIGLWIREFSNGEVSGLVNNSTYKDFTPNLSEIKLNLLNTSVMTWSVYTMDDANITLKGSIVGEIGAQNRSIVTANKIFCDGSGGYVWGTDTTFTIVGFCSATTAVRSQGNGIVVLAYSALTMGQATATQNSILMVLQSTVPDEPKPYDKACVWYANTEKPTIANVNSNVALIGSVWITKTAESQLMNFGKYKMFYRQKPTDEWIQIPGEFKKQVRHDTLAVWNTNGLAPNNYSIKILIFDDLADSMEAISSINLLPKDMAVEISATSEPVNIYPNPADNFIILSSAQNLSNKCIKIYDIFGKEIPVEPEFISDGSIKIRTSDLTTGLYFLRLDTGNNSCVREFRIIQE